MKYSNVCVTMLLAISLVSCNNETICTNENLENNRFIVDVVKNGLIELNASYKPAQNSQKSKIADGISVANASLNYGK